ncbi:MAG TPA: S46 family peptidase [Saprospiraceae bacterium]|nr:S46 family peptidase [Saprospiraceae bacterium]
MHPFSNLKPRLLYILFLFCISATAYAGEGMWLPFLLKALNESEMKSMGMKMNAEDIYSVNQGSLKDAIVHFGGFCTAEVISDQGLLLTNHHCGFGTIQSHSTLEINYIKNGFWAPNQASEKPSPGLFATFIIRIEDVTEQAMTGIKDQMDAKEKQSVIDANLNTIKNTTPKEKWQEVMIKPFYEANQYYMFVTETYNDVRYVGSPPESIGKFGADTDNWVWPRHTGDFSLFRIYAGPDNRPAAFSPDNMPLKPRHFFPVSLDGIEEGDFTLIFGFPGRTNEYLPSYAVDQIENVIDPERIEIRNISLGIMDQHMRIDQDAHLAYSVKYAGLANSWKKWIGEAQGLKKYHAVEKKKTAELDFIDELQRKKSLCKEYGEILPAMKILYKEIEPIVRNRTLLAEVIGGSNIELFRLTLYADRLVTAYKESGDDGYQKMATRTLDQLDGFYKDYRTEIDKELFVALISHLTSTLSPEYLPSYLSANKSEELAEKIYNQSIWVSIEKLAETIEKGGAAFTSAMESDIAFQLFSALKKVMDSDLSPAYNTLNDKIQIQQKLYMAALMEVYPDRRFYPDANNTMRITYGQVEPYEPKDGVSYKTQTYLDGVMEKYKPGDYEFDVDPRLIALYENHDYGQYGENGKMPVCFIASNHTTGGNSGSPAIDAYGNLIGINFDRVWEGTMSDIVYDKSICRNIMTDVRYILFVIDKFAGAGHLVEEMKLVHPKH